jgi:hypothetical protein
VSCLSGNFIYLFATLAIYKNSPSLKNNMQQKLVTIHTNNRGRELVGNHLEDLLADNWRVINIVGASVGGCSDTFPGVAFAVLLEKNDQE